MWPAEDYEKEERWWCEALETDRQRESDEERETLGAEEKSREIVERDGEKLEDAVASEGTAGESREGRVERLERDEGETGRNDVKRARERGDEESDGRHVGQRVRERGSKWGY